jgi:hypothetical protein
MADLIILGCSFSALQYTGFALLFSFYSIEIARYIISKRASATAAATVDDKFVKV